MLMMNQDLQKCLKIPAGMMITFANLGSSGDGGVVWRVETRLAAEHS
jgi:hypothetical protein